ncbi:hypothetical protein LCGC14_1764870 [marine sediment metagenome]|uniref:Histidine kinase N-terminal 7TM region domain-containing protein n=1 Tax=marine sediment metagenome TaxID=412755 RepID=A0A0F9JZP0_9ZZZZ
MIYFTLITLQILRRKRQRLNIIFSFFFITIIIANILNMVYATMTNETIILILNFFTNFFLCFGPIFILVVNMLILESTIIFSVKRQNRYILYYGLLLLLGMAIFYIFKGVSVTSEFRPKFSPIFLIFILIITAALVVIPIISTSLKIFFSFEMKALKRKWIFYVIGFLGSISIAYLVFINNYLDNDGFRLLVAIYSISVILWGYLMYYGIGFKLKKQEANT